MFESRHQKLLPTAQYYRRQILSFLTGLSILFVALGMGVAGYRYLGGLAWVDALQNAAMILAGMGPVDELHSDAAKIFAAAYAIFSGVIFISVMALILSPAFHRLLHKFHLAEERDN